MIGGQAGETIVEAEQPFDMPAIPIFKVGDGQIHEIETVGWTAPYKIPGAFAGK